ncbi:hypothetical protein [Flocculibacter collagenilyticus]|uniref:hypothetical protein n=1 Tax=Flocculibacter collagenilyticus TaxID=2744479 RepID=UPI0018F336ED|nr:hypothetical protein [Flocculibacter collagenilyticus]
MKHFSFVLLDDLDLTLLNDLESRIEHQETICLKSEQELMILLNCFNSSVSNDSLPQIDDVDSSFILNEYPTPIADGSFDDFYSTWLNKTNRENDMDEYGQLICLNSFLSSNSSNKVVVLSEAI